jgi:cold shock protein
VGSFEFIKTNRKMTKGKVKWYDEVKGFGFIESESGEDVFVHRTGISASSARLQPDAEVNFEIQQGEKGLMAINVTSI